MSEASLDWRQLSNEDRAIAYSPSSCLDGDIADELMTYAERSETAIEQCLAMGGSHVQHRYGPAPNQEIDLVIPPSIGGPPPLVVYFHGGYWQELSKNESLFSAVDCLGENIAFAAVGYTLAPRAMLDEIVDECRSATESLRDNATTFGFDPERIVVAGSSAGAHLAATVALGLSDGWQPAAAALVSGIFELEPLIGTYVNDALALDLAAAHRNSPMLQNLSHFPPCIIVYGQNETPEFKRQSSDLAVELGEKGRPSQLLEIPDRNHFDVVLDLCRTRSKLGKAMLSLVQSTQIS